MYQASIDNDKLPHHIAIIMDGNGRWAKKQGLPRIAGHKAGVKAVQNITKVCGEIGIKTLTLFTFSAENWNRPKTEVSSLTTLLNNSLRKEIKKLMENNVRFSIIGDIQQFDQKTQNYLLDSIHKTRNNSGLNLNLALSYGSRQEIVLAIKKIAKKIESNEISIKDINENLISNNLYTKNLNDPDLLIRTGGELRISNFLLWQIAYTEIHTTDRYWPEFKKIDLINAIYDYQNRERRFGKISEQIQIENE